MANKEKCFYCGGDSGARGPEDGLRPYGPGGAPIHHACMMENPGAEKEAKKHFNKYFNAAPAVVISEKDPPLPLDEYLQKKNAS